MKVKKLMCLYQGLANANGSSTSNDNWYGRVISKATCAFLQALCSQLGFKVLCCGNASDCSKVSEREESGGDGKRLLQISRIPPCDQCLITARMVIAEATKLVFTSLSLISLTREQILQCCDWGHPSGAAHAAIWRILALKNWVWFILC